MRNFGRFGRRKGKSSQIEGKLLNHLLQRRVNTRLEGRKVDRVEFLDFQEEVRNHFEVPFLLEVERLQKARNCRRIFGRFAERVQFGQKRKEGVDRWKGLLGKFGKKRGKKKWGKARERQFGGGTVVEEREQVGEVVVAFVDKFSEEALTVGLVFLN